jgi:hypothetical protein
VYLLIRAILLKTSDRERWVVLALNLTTGVVVGVAFLAMFVSVWQDQDFRRNIFYDQASMERSIQTGIREQLGNSVDVQCPTEPLVGIGHTFDCTIYDASGRAIATATVTWTDNYGGYKWTATGGGATSSQDL